MSTNPEIVGPYRKATASDNVGNCAELAPTADGGVAFRNSRHPDGPVLFYTPGEFAALVDGMKKGEFDRLVTDL